ncbi:MAG: restriction endonuclease [Dehalococcoidia bacterium]|nr:restriction endonuclease [Dehalococcoidia bacterium]
MTRLIVGLAAVSGPVAYFDPNGYRWAGVVGLAAAVMLTGTAAGRWSRRRAARRSVEGLRKLHPGDFEAEVAGWLQREGWSVERRGGAGDGGIDLVARKRGETLAVQCKRYAERATVTASQVRELYGAAVAEGATGAMLVTTGRVSKVAREWCEGLPSGLRAVLVEGADLASIAAGGRLLR